MGEAIQSGGEKDVVLSPSPRTGLLLHVSVGHVARHVRGVLTTLPGVITISGPALSSSLAGDGDLLLSLVFMSALNSFLLSVELDKRLGSS